MVGSPKANGGPFGNRSEPYSVDHAYNIRFMKPLKRSFLRFGVAVSLCAFGLAAAFGGGAASLSSAQKTEVLASIRSKLETKAFVPNVQFDKWDGYIAKYKKQLDAAKNDSEFALAVEEALQGFGISHIGLITPQAASARIDHSIVGIGISFFPETDGSMTVTRVFPKSAAAKAKLMPGDRIVSVEGKKDNLRGRIAGPKGTNVKLKVEHADGKFQTYTMNRQPFDTTIPPELVKVNDTTSLLTIPTFDVTYSVPKVRELISEAKDTPNLIIDLRSNPGGAVLNMLDFLGQTLKPGTAIGEIVTPQEVKKYQQEHPGPVDVVKVAADIPAEMHLRVSPPDPAAGWYKGHIAVLVDQASGSAAEIAAQALKETRGAVVVGAKSAGAVLVSVIEPISDGFMLQYPLFDYVSAGGVRLEGHGVIPDILAKTPIIPDIKNDPSIQAAAKALIAEDQKGSGDAAHVTVGS